MYVSRNQSGSLIGACRSHASLRSRCRRLTGLSLWPGSEIERWAPPIGSPAVGAMLFCTLVGVGGLVVHKCCTTRQEEQGGSKYCT